MIKRQSAYKTETREAMRGGPGKVTIDHFWSPGEELKANYRLFARLTLEPGAGIGFHQHDNEEEVFVVLKGQAEADDNGTKVTLEPGDTILTGGGAGHAITSIGKEPLVLLAVIAKY